jgi:hypothetical protein
MLLSLDDVFLQLKALDHFVPGILTLRWATGVYQKAEA